MHGICETRQARPAGQAISQLARNPLPLPEFRPPGNSAEAQSLLLLHHPPASHHTSVQPNANPTAPNANGPVADTIRWLARLQSVQVERGRHRGCSFCLPSTAKANMCVFAAIGIVHQYIALLRYIQQAPLNHLSMYSPVNTPSSTVGEDKSCAPEDKGGGKRGGYSRLTPMPEFSKSTTLRVTQEKKRVLCPKCLPESTSKTERRRRKDSQKTEEDQKKKKKKTQ